MASSCGRHCPIATGTERRRFNTCRRPRCSSSPVGSCRCSLAGSIRPSSPAQHFSELLGADLQVHRRETLPLPCARTSIRGARADRRLLAGRTAVARARALLPRHATHAMLRSRVRVVRACCSSAVRRFPKRFSCGGTSWRGLRRRSATRATTGRVAADSATSRPTRAAGCLLPSWCDSRDRIP